MVFFINLIILGFLAVCLFFVGYMAVAHLRSYSKSIFYSLLLLLVVGTFVGLGGFDEPELLPSPVYSNTEYVYQNGQTMHGEWCDTVMEGYYCFGDEKGSTVPRLHAMWQLDRNKMKSDLQAVVDAYLPRK